MKDLEFLTGPALFLVSWLLFGVYEIGYAIEDPFQGTLRLSILCDIIRRDVYGDEIIRSTAFDLKDSNSEEDDDEDDEEYYEDAKKDDTNVDTVSLSSVSRTPNDSNVKDKHDENGQNEPTAFE